MRLFLFAAVIYAVRDVWTLAALALLIVGECAYELIRKQKRGKRMQ